MKKLYYTITPEVYPNGVHSGFRSIKVYQVMINQPKLLCKISAITHYSGKGTNSDEVEIQTWLDHNGYGDRMFKFIKL